VTQGISLSLYETEDASDYFYNGDAIVYINEGKIILLEKKYKPSRNYNNEQIFEQYFFDSMGNLILVIQSEQTPVYSKSLNINIDDKEPIDYINETVKYFYRNNENIRNTDGNNNEIDEDFPGMETEISQNLNLLRNYLNRKK
jgi:hypothetical protein